MNLPSELILNPHTERGGGALCLDPGSRPLEAMREKERESAMVLGLPVNPPSQIRGADLGADEPTL